MCQPGVSGSFVTSYSVGSCPHLQTSERLSGSGTSSPVDENCGPQRLRRRALEMVALPPLRLSTGICREGLNHPSVQVHLTAGHCSTVFARFGTPIAPPALEMRPALLRQIRLQRLDEDGACRSSSHQQQVSLSRNVLLMPKDRGYPVVSHVPNLC